MSENPWTLVGVLDEAAGIQSRSGSRQGAQSGSTVCCVVPVGLAWTGCFRRMMIEEPAELARQAGVFCLEI